MDREPNNATLLMIAQDIRDHHGLQDELAGLFGTVWAADSIASTWSVFRQESVSVVLCHWEWIVSTPHAQHNIERLLNQSRAIVFYSTRQSAAVRFRCFGDQSLYCLQSSACTELIQPVSRLAVRLNRRWERESAPRGPHFVFPLESSPAVVVSNIHTLY